MLGTFKLFVIKLPIKFFYIMSFKRIINQIED